MKYQVMLCSLLDKLCNLQQMSRFEGSKLRKCHSLERQGVGMLAVLQICCIVFNILPSHHMQYSMMYTVQTVGLQSSTLSLDLQYFVVMAVGTWKSLLCSVCFIQNPYTVFTLHSTKSTICGLKQFTPFFLCGLCSEGFYSRAS